MDFKDCGIILANLFDRFVIESLELLDCLFLGGLKAFLLRRNILDMHASYQIIFFGKFLNGADSDSPERNLSRYALHHFHFPLLPLSCKSKKPKKHIRALRLTFSV